MPPKPRITRQAIVQGALETVRTQGPDALNARTLAAQLGCSTQPIFSNFATMEDLRAAVIEAAATCYRAHTQALLAQNRYPPYKASGMAYISFAQQEKQLFRLLFMRNRTAERTVDSPEDMRPIYQSIMQATGLDETGASLFHLQMWAVVHGIATMLVTDYLQLEEELISTVLSNVYRGLLTQTPEGGNHAGH